MFWSNGNNSLARQALADLTRTSKNLLRLFCPAPLTELPFNDNILTIRFESPAHVSGRFVGSSLRGHGLHSPKRVLFLDLVLTLFRLNGLLIAEGDAMTKDLGLTHARWKVIGAIALSNAGLTVPGIARVLGQSRQAVQRITDVMVADGILVYTDNPKHKRSALVTLSEKGQDTYTLLREVQDPWAIKNTDDIPIEELETTLRLVRRLIKKFN